MIDDLRERIYAQLLVQDGMTAIELAGTLEENVEAVRNELRGLIQAGRAIRIHAAPGVLRYRAVTKRTRYHDCVVREQPAPAPAPAPDPKVELLLAEIDRIAGRTVDPLQVLAALETLGARVAMHLHSAMTEAEAIRARNQEQS